MVSAPPRAAANCQQTGFAYRFDWGLAGLQSLAPVSDVVILVDILQFTSAVSAGVEGGSVMLPFPPDFAPGTDEANGSRLACAARGLGDARILAGALRNASATARFAKTIAGPDGVISVIAAGEQPLGGPDRVRFAFEDLVGAGAILCALDFSGAVGGARCSPEASTARAAFNFARPRLFHHLSECVSGRELIACGREDDVAASAAHDVTVIVAELVGNEFVGTALSGA